MPWADYCFEPVEARFIMTAVHYYQTFIPRTLINALFSLVFNVAESPASCKMWLGTYV